MRERDDPWERYLWQRDGAVDPFVARLESALGPTRARVRASGRSRRSFAPVVGFGALAAVAAVALFTWFGRDDEAARADDAIAAPISHGVSQRGEVEQDAAAVDGGDAAAPVDLADPAMVGSEGGVLPADVTER